jgi:hypothetical protein
MNMITPIIIKPRSTWALRLPIMLAQGMSISEACEQVGVSRSTYYRHLSANLEFRHQVEYAQHSVKSECLTKVMSANDWRAVAWYLEKRYPDEWGTVADKLRIRRCRCDARGTR